MKVTEKEGGYDSPLKGSGPAFQTSYDNKYKQSTSFASDTGRYKNPLNINKHTSDDLKKAEKVDPLYELKDSNISFVHPELGESPAVTMNDDRNLSTINRSTTSQKQQRKEKMRFNSNNTSLNRTMDFKSYSSNLSPRATAKPYDMWKQ